MTRHLSLPIRPFQLDCAIVEGATEMDQNEDKGNVGNGYEPSLSKREEFGAWMRDRRKAVGLTQAELAKAVGCNSTQLISNIERAVGVLPTQRIPEFARVLKCSVAELEIRFFSAYGKNPNERRLPGLLEKYLPLIELIEAKTVDVSELNEIIKKIQSSHPKPDLEP